MLLMDGVTRAMYRDPSAGPQPMALGQVCRVTIALGDIHHTFRAGSRIEIDVTSSNFPRRARNTNSGHPVLARDCEADIRVATTTVQHVPTTPSFVELPVLGRQKQARQPLRTFTDESSSLGGGSVFMSPDRAHEAVGGARGTESLQTPAGGGSQLRTRLWKCQIPC